jgi:hypothetical protein
LGGIRGRFREYFACLLAACCSDDYLIALWMVMTDWWVFRQSSVASDESEHSPGVVYALEA